MKKIHLLILTLFSVFSTALAAGDLYEELTAAISSANASAVAKHFDANVDLTIEGIAKEDLYAKARAEQYLKDFFARNPVKSFTIIHKGSSKEGSPFGIGKLTTADGTSYRVNFVAKNINGQSLVQEFRLEKQ